MSQSAIRYHMVQPQNVKGEEGYGEYDTVDFVLSAEGRKLTGGSVVLLGDVVLNGPDGTATNPFPTILDYKVAYDGFVGSHSFIERIDTLFEQVGNIENISDYPKFVSGKAQASLCKEDLFNSVYTCENRVADSDTIANGLLKGSVDVSKCLETTWNPEFVKPMDFALKLDMAVNNLIGDNMLPYAKTGDIRISLKLAPNAYCLYGDAAIGGVINYSLKNLRIMYQSTPDDGKYSPKYTMRIKAGIRQSVQSSFANISTKVPILADSFWATFIQQSEENNPLANGMKNERIPLLQELQVIWNDAMNQQITYTIESEEEVVHNFITAVAKVVSTNNCSLNVLSSNQGYGIGMAFQQFVDLSRSKIGINIKSAITNLNPYVGYFFFSGLLSI